MGRVAPGFVGFAVFLSYYLGLNFRVAGQREWHSAFFGMCALLLPVLWAGRGGRLLSGIALGVALIFRPQSIVFVPAIALAIDMGTRRPGERWTRTLPALVEYSVAAGVALALGFLPLIQAGVMRDFVESLRQMGSSESNYRVGSRIEPVLRLYRLITVMPGMLYIPLLIAALWSKEATTRRACVLALVALPLTCLYSILSPRDHAYFQIPVAATLAMGMTCLTALILQANLNSRMTLVAMSLCLVVASPRLPTHNLFKTYNELQFTFNEGNILNFREALSCLRHKRLPIAVPSGFVDNYEWYRIYQVVNYLRNDVPQSVPVNNLLFDTFSSITSMSGHLAGMPSDNYGILLSHAWIDRTVVALKQPEPSLVVWNPLKINDVDPAFAKMDAAIRENYQPSRRFGEIEIWSRKGQF